MSDAVFDPSAAILGPIFIVLELNCRTPTFSNSVWLVLPPYNGKDDYEQVGTRIIGPVAPAIADAVAGQLEIAFKNAACDVHRIVATDD